MATRSTRGRWWDYLMILLCIQASGFLILGTNSMIGRATHVATLLLTSWVVYTNRANRRKEDGLRFVEQEIALTKFMGIFGPLAVSGFNGHPEMLETFFRKAFELIDDVFNGDPKDAEAKSRDMIEFLAPAIVPLLKDPALWPSFAEKTWTDVFEGRMTDGLRKTLPADDRSNQGS